MFSSCHGAMSLVHSRIGLFDYCVSKVLSWRTPIFKQAANQVKLIKAQFFLNTRRGALPLHPQKRASNGKLTGTASGLQFLRKIILKDSFNNLPSDSIYIYSYVGIYNILRGFAHYNCRMKPRIHAWRSSPAHCCHSNSNCFSLEPAPVGHQ